MQAPAPSQMSVVQVKASAPEQDVPQALLLVTQVPSMQNFSWHGLVAAAQFEV
jgi:hypothetical protein